MTLIPIFAVMAHFSGNLSRMVGKLDIYLILVLIFGFSNFAFSQNDPLLRVEIETKSDAATYKLTTCGEKGVVIFYETTLKQDVYKFWVFVLYNKFLQETWKKDVPIFENMNYHRETISKDNLYVLFYNADKKKSEQYNYQVLKISLTTGIYELFSGQLPANSDVVDFEIFENYAVTGLNIEQKRGAFYSLDMGSKETKAIFVIEKEESRFGSFYTDTVNNNLFAVFNVYESKTSFFHLIKKYNISLEERTSIQLNPQQDKKLNNARITSIDGNEQLVIGTYNVIKGGSIGSKDYFMKSSTGFYTAKIFGSSITSVNYYHFLELENMTGYLRSKEYQQIKKKADKEDEDINKYTIDFDLLLHDIILHDSLYYFVAEAFYEQYRTVTSTYYDYYGHAVPVTYSVFDGYKYFNAFISCFDPDGIKTWDNGMEIFNILSFKLENRVNVYFEGDHTVLAYNREGKIASKIIRGSDIVEGVAYYPLETTYVNDKVMADTKSNMQHWYDHYFIAYGFQTIRNNSLINANKRIVFYISKVAFQ